MITKEELKEFLVEWGWHISDGIDDCSGWDEVGMDASVDELLEILAREEK
jgi:hypothetical protein